MWGLFAGEARKQPPHIPFSTAIPKDPQNHPTRISIYNATLPIVDNWSENIYRLSTTERARECLTEERISAKIVRGTFYPFVLSLMPGKGSHESTSYKSGYR